MIVDYFWDFIIVESVLSLLYTHCTVLSCIKPCLQKTLCTITLMVQTQTRTLLTRNSSLSCRFCICRRSFKGTALCFLKWGCMRYSFNDKCITHKGWWSAHEPFLPHSSAHFEEAKPKYQCCLLKCSQCSWLRKMYVLLGV